MSTSSDEQDKDIPLKYEESNGNAVNSNNRSKRKDRNGNAKVAPSDNGTSPDNESSSDEEYQFKEEDTDAIPNTNTNTGPRQRHQSKTYDSDSDRRVSTDSIEIHDNKASLSPKEVNIEVQSRAQIKEAWPKKSNKKVWFSSLELQNLAVSLKYVVTDTKRHKRDWLIGLVTVFLVVLVVSLLQNAISKSPIIFMKLAEDSVGEYDLYLTPQITADSTTYLLNWTQVNQTLTSAPLVTGSTPRWVILAKLSNSLNRTESTSTAVLAIDSEQEKRINLGRGWDHPTLGENEMHVSRSVLSSIGVKPNAGETVFLDISIGGVLQSTGVLDNGALSDYIFSQLGPLGNSSIQDMTLGQLLDMIEGPLAAIGINATEFIEGVLGTALPPLNTTAQDYLNQQLANFTISKEYLVMDEITDPNGKYPKALGNVAMIESKYISDLIKETASNFNYTQLIDDLITLEKALEPFLNQTQIDTLNQIINALQGFENITYSFIDGFQVNDYALSIVVMYAERFKTYMLGQSALTQKMIDFTNQVSDTLGYTYPATYTLPIYTALVPLYYIRLLLNQIFTFVVVVLIVLGGLLIYSLLLSNVEEKTYEYGMLRALGMQSYVLVELLVTQSFSFSVPGVGIGLLFSFIVFIPIGYYISDFALSPLDITMDGTAAILATVLGLVLPLIAIVGPIQRALSRTLRDALDIYHLVQSEVTVRIIKLEKLGLSPWQITGSITMIVMGFVVYYIIPYSFTFQNLDLFFTILILILLGMLLGLSLIAITLQPFLERLVVYVLLWGEDRRTLTELVKKNLGAHSRRNIKTAVMFTTALAFIIFAGVSFSLQGVTIANSVRLLSGADIAVVAPTLGSSVTLNEEGIRGFLDAEMKKSDPLVLGYVFTTPPLTQSMDYITSTQLSNLAGYPQTRVMIYGIEISYLPNTYTYFYQPQEVSSQFSYSQVDGKPDVIKSLYTDAGKAQLPQEKDGINVPPDVTTAPAYYNVNNTESTEEAYKDYVDVIISEAMRLTASVDVNTPLRIKINFNLDSANSTSRVYLGKSRAMISQLPGFFFSSYRQTAYSSPVLVSMDQYYRIMKETYDQGNNRDSPLPAVPPKGQLHVHLKSDLDVAGREIVLNGIRNFIDNDLIQIFDTKDVVGSTTSALDLLTLFFNVVAVIAVVLCFFVLWLSFTANVNENAWEFGVLRALGLNSLRVIRMYIYEALCIIVTSILTGSIIGLLVSITLTLQFLLFSEMAFVFAFPYALFFSVLGMSVLVAVLGSYIPSKVVLNKPIAIALKNM